MKPNQHSDEQFPYLVFYEVLPIFHTDLLRGTIHEKLGLLRNANCIAAVRSAVDKFTVYWTDDGMTNGRICNIPATAWAVAVNRLKVQDCRTTRHSVAVMKWIDADIESGKLTPFRGFKPGKVVEYDQKTRTAVVRDQSGKEHEAQVLAATTPVVEGQIGTLFLLPDRSKIFYVH